MYIAVTIVGSLEMSLPMIMNTPVGLALCIGFVLLMRKYITQHTAATAPSATRTT
jgi:bile acid:Na+ symporter, BASS family